MGWGIIGLILCIDGFDQMNKNLPTEIWDMIEVERRRAFRFRVAEFEKKTSTMFTRKNDMRLMFKRNLRWDLHFSAMFVDRYLFMFVEGKSRGYVKDPPDQRVDP